MDTKQKRKELGLSQSEFAKALGVSVKTVQNWEQGTRNCPEPIKRLILTLRNVEKFKRRKR